MLRTALALLAVLLVPAPGYAFFHLAVIDEIMAGTAVDPSVQYVEIRMLAGTQNVTAQTRLTAFGCDGTTSAVLLLVAANVPIDGAGVRWIMATPSRAAFLAASGIAADFTWDPAAGTIDPTCGMVCWGAPGTVPPSPTWNATDPNNYVDCVGYGGYTGPRKTSTHDSTPTSGAPTPLPTGTGVHSLTRTGTSGSNAADFVLACPTPENNAGATGGFGACSPPTTTTTTATTGTSTTTTLALPLMKSRCTARKIRAAGKKSAAKGRCEARAAARGVAVDGGCAGAAEARFDRGWARAERRGDCLVPAGDRAAIEEAVDVFLADLVGALRPDGARSRCASRRIAGAGRFAGAVLGCAGEAVGKGVPLDEACSAKPVRALRAAWSKGDRRGDCPAGGEDLEATGIRVVAFVEALVGRLTGNLP